MCEPHRHRGGGLAENVDLYEADPVRAAGVGQVAAAGLLVFQPGAQNFVLFDRAAPYRGDGDRVIFDPRDPRLRDARSVRSPAVR